MPKGSVVAIHRSTNLTTSATSTALDRSNEQAAHSNDPLPLPPRRVSAWKRNRAYVLGLTPAAILLAVFFLAPAAWALYSSLTNRALVGIDAAHYRFIGLDNYRRLFADPDFFTVIKNSLIFVIGSAMIGQFILGLAMAVLIDFSEKRGYKIALLGYAAVLLAWVNPTVIAGFQWTAMFDFYYGTLNRALNAVGLPSVNWIGQYPMLSVIIVNIWRGTAFAMMIFMGALKTIPPYVYEAARIDGASGWQAFWDHTLPNLRHIMMIVMLSLTISTFGTFLLIQTLTNGGPGIQTEVIALFAYHTAFVGYEIGYGSAIALVMLVMNLVFGIFYIRVSRPKV
ncbi:MAG: carbohydrate ABC transporter permease [Thermomicrobiales bacterium]